MWDPILYSNPGGVIYFKPTKIIKGFRGDYFLVMFEKRREVLVDMQLSRL